MISPARFDVKEVSVVAGCQGRGVVQSFSDHGHACEGNSTACFLLLMPALLNSPRQEKAGIPTGGGRVTGGAPSGVAFRGKCQPRRGLAGAYFCSWA